MSKTLLELDKGVWIDPGYVVAVYVVEIDGGEVEVHVQTDPAEYTIRTSGSTYEEALQVAQTFVARVQYLKKSQEV